MNNWRLVAKTKSQKQSDFFEQECVFVYMQKSTGVVVANRSGGVGHQSALKIKFGKYKNYCMHFNQSNQYLTNGIQQLKSRILSQAYKSLETRNKPKPTQTPLSVHQYHFSQRRFSSIIKIVDFFLIYILKTRPYWPRKVREMKWTVWYAFKTENTTGKLCKSQNDQLVSQ